MSAPQTQGNYSSGNDRFDREAAVLEIGCGTGLLTVPLAEHVGSILALDTANGMINMLNSKLSSPTLQDKVHAKVKLLENPNDPVLSGKKFNIALSHLVFHHVPNMKDLVEVMFGTLEAGKGARIWISDFEDNGPQALLFHPKDKHAGVERHGLLRQEMHDILTQVGFKDVEVFESFRMDKVVESGETVAFPFLAITGLRP